MTAAQVARYHRARLMAHRGWANSQPQYVIPGVLEEVDAALPFVEPHGGVRLLERNPLASGAEPNSGVSHRVPGSRPFCLPRLPGDASAPSTIDGPARMTMRVTRGQGHWR